jgi:ABC-2 type transport system ATP-binding protein
MLKLYGAGPALEAAVLKAERLLLEQPLVAGVSVEGATLRLRLELKQGPPTPGWAEEAATRLLKALVAADLPVCSFQARELDLEDAFMTVTRGKVQ